MLPKREELAREGAPVPFFWLSGIEDTFITAPCEKTTRTLDEYELTGHYRAWRSDLALFDELALRAVRYGIPWHRIQPSPKTWNWQWAERPLERLLELGIEPIVDLVHYGLPGWIDRAYLHPDFDRYMAEYAFRVAERFRGSIRWYTPLNEPRITAWYCGKLGFWPPFARGWRGFAQIAMQIARGTVRTVSAVRQVDASIVFLHVDATDVYESSHETTRHEARLRERLVFLPLDLVTGKVTPAHPLCAWLRAQGVSESELEALSAHAVDLDVVGVNMYPLFSRKVLSRSKHGLRARMPYATAEVLERIVRRYWQRYRRPIVISETASEGSVRRRRAWLDDSVHAVKRLRARGIPVLGYTWWPLFALVTWAYRQGDKSLDEYLKQMGLYDLKPVNGRLVRVPTPLVQAYRALAMAGAAPVGPVSLEKPRVS